jgi:hypothetical protein
VLESTKRARRSTVIFKRLDKPPPVTHVPSSPIATNATIIPEIVTSRPGDEVRDPLALRPRAETKLTHLAVQSLDEAGERTFEVKRLNDVGSLDMDSTLFVYDVFVRHPEDLDSILPPDPKLNTATLFIPIGYEDEWGGNEFWQGDEDDDKVDTDDEDSNAEDYYGADYPEDEDGDKDSNDEDADDDDDDDDDDDHDEFRSTYEVDYQDDESGYVADYATKYR